MLEACLLQKQTDLYLMDGSINRELLAKRLTVLDRLYQSDSLVCDMVRALLSHDEKGRMYPFEYLSLFHPLTFSNDPSSLVSFNEPLAQQTIPADQSQDFCSSQVENRYIKQYDNEVDQNQQVFETQYQDSGYFELSEQKELNRLQQQIDGFPLEYEQPNEKNEPHDWDMQGNIFDQANSYPVEEPYKIEEVVNAAVYDQPQRSADYFEKNIQEIIPEIKNLSHDEISPHLHKQYISRIDQSPIQYPQTLDSWQIHHAPQPQKQRKTSDFPQKIISSNGHNYSRSRNFERGSSDYQPPNRIRPIEASQIDKQNFNSQVIHQNPIQVVEHQPVKIIQSSHTVRPDTYEQPTSLADLIKPFKKIPSSITRESNPTTLKYRVAIQPTTPNHRVEKEKYSTASFKIEDSKPSIRDPDTQKLKTNTPQNREVVSTSVHQETNLQIPSHAKLQEHLPSSSSSQNQIPRNDQLSFLESYPPPRLQYFEETSSFIRPASQNHKIGPSASNFQALVKQSNSLHEQKEKLQISSVQTNLAPIKIIRLDSSETAKFPTEEKQKKPPTQIMLRRSAPIVTEKPLLHEQPIARAGRQIRTYTEQLPVETKIVGSKTFVVFVERGSGSANRVSINGRGNFEAQFGIAGNKIRQSTGTHAVTKNK